MKEILTYLRIAVVATVVLAFLVSGIYPAIVWGVSQVVFNDKANGSLIVRDGKVVGSRLIGQSFTGERYFHPRPSAAGSGYDPSSSGGTNLGPTSSKLINGLPDDPSTADTDESFAGVAQLVATYRKTNGLSAETPVPADAVMRSASGVDPHISLANARLQAPRVATARGLSPDAVRAAVERNTDARDLGLFGEPRVNVLTLNLDLDDEVNRAGKQ